MEKRKQVKGANLNINLEINCQVRFEIYTANSIVEEFVVVQDALINLVAIVNKFTKRLNIETTQSSESCTIKA